MQRPLDAICDFFSGGGAHAAAHEREVEADHHQWLPGQDGLAPGDRLVDAGAGSALFDPLAVRLRILETERIGGGNVLILFVKRSGLDQHRDPQGMLYGSYADALSLIATALPDRDHLWRDTVAADDIPATPSTEDTPHANV